MLRPDLKNSESSLAVFVDFHTSAQLEKRKRVKRLIEQLCLQPRNRRESGI